MTNAAHMTAAVDAYVAAFEANDPTAVAALYAEDASVQDPLEAPKVEGRNAILAFYQQAMATGAKLTLQGPVRIAANTATFPFSVNLQMPHGPARIDVIDTFEFTPDGLIQKMTAYWGPTNMHGFEE